MSTPRAIHRRRRAAFVVLLALGIVVALALWRPWASAEAPPASTAEPTPSATASPTPSPTPDEPFTPIGGVPDVPGEGVPCAAEQVVITPMTDATTYGADQQVQMSFIIENVGEAACSLNVGTTQQSYEIRTGDLVVYRSTDCPVGTVDQVVELAPRVQQTTVPIVWDRTASSPDTCTTVREPVAAGGASYHLSITVAGFQAASTRQFILG